MRCWGELKSLRAQSVGEVSVVTLVMFRICGNESQPGLQLVEKLATPLLSVKGILNVRFHPKNIDWPFRASHSRATTLPCWRAKDAQGQDKQKPYII